MRRLSETFGALIFMWIAFVLGNMYTTDQFEQPTNMLKSKSPRKGITDKKAEERGGNGIKDLDDRAKEKAEEVKGSRGGEEKHVKSNQESDTDKGNNKSKRQDEREEEEKDKEIFKKSSHIIKKGGNTKDTKKGVSEKDEGNNDSKSENDEKNEKNSNKNKGEN